MTALSLATGPSARRSLPRCTRHLRRHERLDILLHAARYGLSVEKVAEVVVVTQQTIFNWRRVMHRRNPHLLPPLRGLAVGAIRGAPSSVFAVRLLRRAMRRNGTPRWLVIDKDPVLRGGLVQRLLTAHGILRRYGAVGRRGSLALIERAWRSMKQEYVRHLFLHRPIRALETHLRWWARWHNSRRPRVAEVCLCPKFA